MPPVGSRSLPLLPFASSRLRVTSSPFVPSCKKNKRRAQNGRAFFVILEALLRLRFDFHAHLAGGAGDDPHGGFFGAGIEILHLAGGDLLELLFGELAHLDLVRLLRT